MKTKLLLGLALAFAATSIAHADIVIEQTIESSVQPTSKMTMKMKGSKLRTDIGDQMTSILDTETFDSITLMHPNKTIIKGDGAQLKAAAATATEDLSMKPVDTGKTEKVGGYNCSVWTVDVAGSKITIWATKDYPDYAAIKAELDVQTKASGQPNPMAAIDGMVMKTVAEIAGTKMTTTLDSAKKTPVDDSEFATPAGYTEMVMPK
ncbi:DUF4412 domain-containing protein [Phragmitibacter flavus]|nr:DUF4412 domain-containing protein [Phragmitibacter flavus]